MREDKETENKIEKEILDVETIKEMLRHLHNDVENIRRDLVMVMHKVDGVAYLHEVSRRSVEEAINNFDINLDELYSPIDIKDKKEWEDHLKSEVSERHEKDRFEELKGM